MYLTNGSEAKNHSEKPTASYACTDAKIDLCLTSTYKGAFVE